MSENLYALNIDKQCNTGEFQAVVRLSHVRQGAFLRQQQSSPMDTILNHFYPILFPISLRSILMLSFHLYLGVFATSTWGILDWRLAV
jgi:hypothetical protein